MARSLRGYVGQHWRSWMSIPLAVAGFLAIAYVVLKLAPDWFAETEHLDPKGEADARQGVRTASLALLAGAIAVVGAVYTARTFGLNRAGQLTDRFSKAIEQLGRSDELDVRLGGIYALERIARDSADDHPQVVEVLTAYIREHAGRPQSAPDDAGPTFAGERTRRKEPPKPATDVQAVLTVLGRRTLAHDQVDMLMPLALQATDLSGATLHGAALSSANLVGTDLSHASLIDANLSGAFLVETNLRSATLVGANLSGAVGSGTNLAFANLKSADLRKAHLIRANLQWANLVDANLSGVTLTEVKLEGAKLSGANLSGATISEASFDPQTIWPEGFEPPAA